MSVERGNVAELLFALHATRKGCGVSKPLFNGTTWDLVVHGSDATNSPHTVQVKRAFGKGKARVCNVSRGCCNKKVRYVRGDFDLLGVVEVDGMTATRVWLIPAEEVISHMRITVSAPKYGEYLWA